MYSNYSPRNSTTVNRSPSPYISSSPLSEYSLNKNDINNYTKKPKYTSDANGNKYYQLTRSPTEENYDRNKFLSSDYSSDYNSNTLKDQKKATFRFDSFNTRLYPETNETMKKADSSAILQQEIDKLSRENENLKNENRLLNNDSQKLKDIENVISNQGYRNKTNPIDQIIETIIIEKDNQIENLKKQSNEYKAMIDNIQTKVYQLFNNQENNQEMPLENLIAQSFAELNKKYKLYRKEYIKLKKSIDSQNSPQKQNDTKDEIKKLIIEKGKIKQEDQNKTEIELVNQILSQNSQYKNLILKTDKENKTLKEVIKKIKKKLIEDGKLNVQEYQNQDANAIIDKIISDKNEFVDTLNNEINYLQNEIKEIKSQNEKLQMQKENLYEDQNIIKCNQNSNEELRNQLSGQIEQIQNLLTSLNETKLSMQTKIDDIDHKKEEEIERINEQNEQLKEEINNQKNIILSLTNEKEELKNQTEQLQKNADEKENIISLLKQEKEELKNQKDSSIDDIKKNTVKILEMLENNDQLKEVKNSNTSKDNEEENLDQSEEKEDNLDQSEEKEDNLDQQKEEKSNQKDEEVQLDQTKEKEILDELVEIMKNDSLLNDGYLENKYDFVIDNIQKMMNKIKNVEEEKENSEKEESIDEKQIQKLKDLNDELNRQINKKDERIYKLERQNKAIQKQKVISEDLLRRHITLVQSENDKQLKRIKYFQKLEINEILNNKVSKEKGNDNIENTNEKAENNDNDDSEDYEDD